MKTDKRGIRNQLELLTNGTLFHMAAVTMDNIQNHFLQQYDKLCRALF